MRARRAAQDGCRAIRRHVRSNLSHPVRRHLTTRRLRPRRSRIRETARDHLPLHLQAALVRPAPKAVVGLALVIAVGVVLAVWWAWAARPEARPAPTLQRGAPVEAAQGLRETPAPEHSVAPGGVTAGSVSRATKADVTVHVAGAVRRPGVVRLPTGSRVADAVERAPVVVLRKPLLPASTSSACSWMASRWWCCGWVRSGRPLWEVRRAGHNPRARAQRKSTSTPRQPNSSMLSLGLAPCWHHGSSSTATALVASRRWGSCATCRASARRRSGRWRSSCLIRAGIRGSQKG